MFAEGHKVASLDGAKEGSERDSIIDSFREGRKKALITTNVISRGIDVLQVTPQGPSTSHLQDEQIYPW